MPHPSSPVGTATVAFSLKPLMFETFVCTMAMMSFVALARPIARMTGMAAWQMGAVVTAAGIIWDDDGATMGSAERPAGTAVSDPDRRRGVRHLLRSDVGVRGCRDHIDARTGVVFAGLLGTRGLAGIKPLVPAKLIDLSLSCDAKKNLC